MTMGSMTLAATSSAMTKRASTARSRDQPGATAAASRSGGKRRNEDADKWDKAKDRGAHAPQNRIWYAQQAKRRADYRTEGKIYDGLPDKKIPRAAPPRSRGAAVVTDIFSTPARRTILSAKSYCSVNRTTI